MQIFATFWRYAWRSISQGTIIKYHAYSSLVSPLFIVYRNIMYFHANLISNLFFIKKRNSRKIRFLIHIWAVSLKLLFFYRIIIVLTYRNLIYLSPNIQINMLKVEFVSPTAPLPFLQEYFSSWHWAFKDVLPQNGYFIVYV